MDTFTRSILKNSRYGVSCIYCEHSSTYLTNDLHIYQTWLVSAAVSDVGIALSMIYYLIGSQTGIKSTGLLITKIIRVSVETGLVCAGLSCLDLILFLVFPNTNFHLTPSIALCKLYSNSLLVVSHLIIVKYGILDILSRCLIRGCALSADEYLARRSRIR